MVDDEQSQMFTNMIESKNRPEAREGDKKECVTEGSVGEAFLLERRSKLKAIESRMRGTSGLRMNNIIKAVQEFLEISSLCLAFLYGSTKFHHSETDTKKILPLNTRFGLSRRF